MVRERIETRKPCKIKGDGVSKGRGQDNPARMSKTQKFQ